MDRRKKKKKSSFVDVNMDNHPEMIRKKEHARTEHILQELKRTQPAFMSESNSL